MAKICLMALVALLAFAKPIRCNAQNQSPALAPVDSTPIEDLDYHLNKIEFLYYYGDDDTSRALICMFFRQRSFLRASNYYTYTGTQSDAGTVCLTCVSISFLSLIPNIVVAAIGCSNYQRQDLLYLLVNREHGKGLPDEYANKLEPIDFQN